MPELPASQETPLHFGSEVVQHLLPHRRPLLLVDAVTSYRRSPLATLAGKRHISANEEIFAGHFPDLHLWPGIYTQEGLGQCCHLLQVIAFLQDAWQARGQDPEEVLLALRQLDRGYRLQPGLKPQADFPWRELSGAGAKIGMAGSVDMRFLAPVFAGQCLEYRVTRTHVLENLSRFEVEATVEGRCVAKGKLTGAVLSLSKPLSE